MAELPPLPQGAKLNQESALPPLPTGAKMNAESSLPPLPAGAKMDTAQPAYPKVAPAAPAVKPQEKPGYFKQVEENVIQPLAGVGRTLIAPFLSKEHQQELQAKGLLPGQPKTFAQSVNEGPIGQAAAALYTGVTAPIAPLIASGVEHAEKTGAISPETVAKIQAGLNIASIAGAPAIREAGLKASAVAADVAKGVEKIASPATVSPQAGSMEATIRQAQGESSRSTAQAEATLAKSAKEVSAMTPQQTLDFYNHVENVSKPGAKPTLPPTIQQFAEDTRGIMKNMRTRLEDMPKGDTMGFVEDYFPHMWKDPAKAQAFATDFVSRQGSSAATRARKLPTIADGLQAGLELADPNPVRAASRYVTTTNNFIASKEILDQALKKGDAKYYTPGKQPAGWVELTGRNSERTRSFVQNLPTGEPSAGVIREKLYAPADVARVYNNFFKPGLERTDLAKPYELTRAVTAANTASELALSAYHFSTITMQNMFTDVARAVKNASVGDLPGVAKALKSATVGQLPGIKGGSYSVGRDFIKQYKGLEDMGVDMENVVEHFEKAGGKLGQERLYRVNPEGGFVHAWKQGQLKPAVDELRQLAGSGPVGAIQATMKTMGKVAEDISYPLFEHYIPRIKAGAFANLMSDYLRQNPLADAKSIEQARIHIMDMVDDRFGEMNMDNIFWSRLQKQSLALILRAQGWDIGLVRQLGGGMLDTGRILKSLAESGTFDRKLLDRPIFLGSAVMTTMLMNAAYQYMKTGQPPQNFEDLIVPRTGGKTPQGKPERFMMPGHAREIIQMQPVPGEGPLSGVAGEAYNKIASFPKNIYEALTNRDFADRPIGTGLERMAHVAGGFMPFSVSDQNAPKKGTNLNWFERRVLGERPAGLRFTDPALLEYLIRRKEQKEEKSKIRSERRRKQENQ